MVVTDTSFVRTFMHTSWVEDVRYHSAAPHPQVRAMRADDDFYHLLFDTVRSQGLAWGTTGLETAPDIATYLSVDEYRKIWDALPDATIVSADDTIFAQRAMKTPTSRRSSARARGAPAWPCGRRSMPSGPASANARSTARSGAPPSTSTWSSLGGGLGGRPPRRAAVAARSVPRLTEHLGLGPACEALSRARPRRRCRRSPPPQRRTGSERDCPVLRVARQHDRLATREPDLDSRARYLPTPGCAGAPRPGSRSGRL